MNHCPYPVECDSKLWQIILPCFVPSYQWSEILLNAIRYLIHALRLFLLYRYPPVTVPTIVRVYQGLGSTPFQVWVPAITEMCFLPFVGILMVWNTAEYNTVFNKRTVAVYMIPLPHSNRTYFSGCVAWIMAHFALSMHVSYTGVFFSLPCVGIPIIWNTADYNTVFNKRTVAVPMLLPLSPVEIPILVGV